MNASLTEIIHIFSRSYLRTYLHNIEVNVFSTCFMFLHFCICRLLQAAPVKTGDWNSPLTTVNPWDGLNIMTGWLSSKKLVTHQLPRLLSFKISPQSLNTLYQSQSNLLAFRGFVIYQASYLNKQLGFAPVSERGNAMAISIL